MTATNCRKETLGRDTLETLFCAYDASGFHLDIDGFFATISLLATVLLCGNTVSPISPMPPNQRVERTRWPAPLTLRVRPEGWPSHRRMQ